MEYRKIRVLYINHGTGIGGALISLRNLINELDKDRFSILVLCLRDSSALEYFRSSGIECQLVNCEFYNNQYLRLTHSEPGIIPWYKRLRFWKAELGVVN